jgi:hypothetical protein
MAACSSAQHGSGVASARGKLSAVPVQRTDLPEGWQAVGPATGADKQDQARFLACAHAPSTAGHVTQETQTAFHNGTIGISSHAQRMRAESDVTADRSFLVRSGADACYRAILRIQIAASLPPFTKVISVDFNISPAPRRYPANVVALGSGQARITHGKQTVTTYFTVAHIVGRRLEADVAFTAVSKSIEATLEQKVITLVARRAAAT